MPISCRHLACQKPPPSRSTLTTTGRPARSPAASSVLPLHRSTLTSSRASLAATPDTEGTVTFPWTASGNLRPLFLFGYHCIELAAQVGLHGGYGINDLDGMLKLTAGKPALRREAWRRPRDADGADLRCLGRRPSSGLPVVSRQER